MKVAAVLLLLPFAMCRLPPRTNTPGKDLVVISAPSMWDSRYKDRFQDLIKFDLSLVKTIMSRDNVLILADRYTMRYLKGKVPDDVILEADIYDIWMRQFGPMLTKGGELAQFDYERSGMDKNFQSQVQLSLKSFIRDHYLQIDETSNLVIYGDEIVSNGIGKAIVPEALLDRNLEKYQDWAIRIQVFNNFGRTIFLEPFTNTTFHEEEEVSLEHLLSFITPNVLAMTELNPVDMERIQTLIAKKFRGDVSVLPIRTHYASDGYKEYKSTCGFHTSLLVTKHHIYMPVYGNDPANWEIGHSSILDKIAYRKIQVNTPRRVIPVNVPRRICQMGGSPRSLTWQLKGAPADRLVNLARMRANIRRVLAMKFNTKKVTDKKTPDAPAADRGVKADSDFKQA